MYLVICRFELSALVWLRTNLFSCECFVINGKDLLFTSESIKRAALQAISNDQVSVPSLVIAVFTHDLWLDHYECYYQLFEDVYANCRRTTLLLGDKCNFKVNIELELGFGQSAHHQDAWIDGVLVDQHHCLARPLVNSGERGCLRTLNWLSLFATKLICGVDRRVLPITEPLLWDSIFCE